MKNCSMKKSSELYGPRSDCPVLWTMTGLGSSHRSFVSSLKRHHFGLSSLFISYTASHGSFSQTRNPRLTLSIKKPLVNTGRNSRFGRHGVWTVKLKSQPKKKNRRRKKWNKQTYLTKKIKQNKKATVRNLSEKWRKVRWDEALVSWRRRTQRKKVEETGRQHKMTKMRGNLKLKRVEIEECD